MTTRRVGREPSVLPTLSDQERARLLAIARATLEAYLTSGTHPQADTDDPALREPRATFVTLRRRDSGELRGCRGEFVARFPLVESVMRMSIASATKDPRFAPVTAAELPSLHIEISVLTPLAPIRPDAIVVGRHGLMITRGRRAGLLLPQVATTYGWACDELLRQLCRKAGLRDDAWKDEDVVLYAFEAEVWGEPEGVS
jgi:AmmeMemoRadiSam system protein A